MKEFVINGNKFRTKKRFYKYAEEIFTYGLSWETGRNLSAFSDILEGGFGQHDTEETIKVLWINMSKSRERLPTKFYNALIEILEDAENVVFEKYEFNK
ncbi:MAG: barstar family protein [Bacteroidota bacterium]